MVRLLQDLSSFIQYNVLGLPLAVPPYCPPDIFYQEIRLIKLNDGGSIAESKKYPNLDASGDNLEELYEAFYDTLLTYSDIPRYFAKRRVNDCKIDQDEGKVLIFPVCRYWR